MSDVTVLMTVFNGMPYLRQSIDSILDQTYSRWRCVVVDDGSTDGTAEYLDSIRDNRFLIIHQPNAGTAAAANRGLAQCEARYTARMDADDISRPDRLARQIAYLDAHPEVGLVGAQVAPMGDATTGRSLKLPTDHETIMAALRSGRHGMAHSCIMFRTDLARRIGGYWSLPLVDDWDFMLRMGEAARLANLGQVLHQYRMRVASLTGSGIARMRFSIDYACELARRRQSGQSLITPDEFQDLRDARPWWRRGVEAIDLHARGQYRLGMAELYGGRRLHGAARLTWAAACSPRLTVQRIFRSFERPRTANDPQQTQGAHG